MIDCNGYDQKGAKGLSQYEAAPLLLFAFFIRGALFLNLQTDRIDHRDDRVKIYVVSLDTGRTTIIMKKNE